MLIKNCDVCSCPLLARGGTCRPCARWASFARASLRFARITRREVLKRCRDGAILGLGILSGCSTPTNVPDSAVSTRRFLNGTIALFAQGEIRVVTQTESWVTAGRDETFYSTQGTKIEGLNQLVYEMPIISVVGGGLPVLDWKRREVHVAIENGCEVIHADDVLKLTLCPTPRPPAWQANEGTLDVFEAWVKVNSYSLRWVR